MQLQNDRIPISKFAGDHSNDQCGRAGDFNLNSYSGNFIPRNSYLCDWISDWYWIRLPDESSDIDCQKVVGSRIATFPLNFPEIGGQISRVLMSRLSRPEGNNHGIEIEIIAMAKKLYSAQTRGRKSACKSTIKISVILSSIRAKFGGEF
jgi:hypothetical protein